MWQNPRVRPQFYPIDSNFDNYWCGGWDEGFPTCDACEYNGESYPNLGELRSIRWTVESLGLSDGAPEALLSALGPISPVKALKRVTLRGTSVIVHYELTNIGPLPCDFIWGSHPALAVTSATVLHIPAETGIVQLSSSPALGVPGQRYPWPMLETPDGTVDMSRVQDVRNGVFCGHFATGLWADAYGVHFAGEDLAVVVRFSREQCPWLWLWLVYGGWRGYHHCVVEPWTSFPVSLAEAVKNGTHRSLRPGQTFSTTINLSIRSGVEHWKTEHWHEELRRIERHDS